VPPALFSAGGSAGAIHFKSGLTEYVLTGLLQFQPRPWLTLGTAASLVRVTPPDSTAFSGFGDLPVSLGLSKQFGGTASPSLGAAFQVSLPTGTRSAGIGSQSVGWAVDVGAGFAPRQSSYLFFNVGRELTPARPGFNRSVQSTSIGADASVDLSPRLDLSVALAADVARTDTIAPLTRTVGAGLGFRLGGALRVEVDGGLGLNNQSPTWLFSVGLGTAFAGVSPVGLNNPVERVKRAFASGSTKVRGKSSKKGG